MPEEQYILAGMPVCIRRRSDRQQTDTAESDGTLPVFSVSDAETAQFIKNYPQNTNAADVEETLLQNRISEYLLRRNAVLFHAAAFLWRGRAWLFSAHSGVGKTTQYLHWKYLWGDAVTIINGDKPILSMDAQKSIRVFPSPWCGKEHLGASFAAQNPTYAENGIPLGGVILLEQGNENRIARVTTDAALPIFSQFMVEWKSPEVLCRIAAMTDAILRSVPVYCLVNVGDTAAAVLTRNTILKDEETGT